MREIKFRGKHKNPYGDKWVYGYYAIEHGEHVIIMPHSTNYETALKENRPISTTSVKHTIDYNTLGQYTGLKDKNKSKIYEGDILRYEGGGIYRVVFDEMMIMCPQDNIEEPSPGYYGILIGDKTKELCPLGVTQRLAKVIGNIHDNPELLESEDK